MIRSVIVDDEPGGISNLKYYLQEYCPEIEVFKTESKLSEIPLLMHEDIDLAFLDIEICDETIFDILKKAGEINFDIVFVTAYEKYALNAFKVDVIDYILKPLKSESILNCYHKILKRYSRYALNSNENTAPAVLQDEKNIVLKQGEHIYIVAMGDIIYMEAKGAYTEICFYQDNKKHLVTVSKSLAVIDAEYKHKSFYKIHRSFIINTDRIKEIRKSGAVKIQMDTGEIIPIARRRWSEFLSANIR